MDHEETMRLLMAFGTALLLLVADVGEQCEVDTVEDVVVVSHLPVRAPQAVALRVRAALQFLRQWHLLQLSPPSLL